MPQRVTLHLKWHMRIGLFEHIRVSDKRHTLRLHLPVLLQLHNESADVHRKLQRNLADATECNHGRIEWIKKRLRAKQHLLLLCDECHVRSKHVRLPNQQCRLCHLFELYLHMQ
jgi:hypothetical protein